MNIDSLYHIICERRDNPSENSYTSRLMAEGEDEIVKKIGEEAVEIILAASKQSDQRLVEEVADLTYHLLVLLAYRRITPEAVRMELEDRHRSAR